MAAINEKEYNSKQTGIQSTCHSVQQKNKHN